MGVVMAFLITHQGRQDREEEGDLILLSTISNNLHDFWVPPPTMYACFSLLFNFPPNKQTLWFILK